MKSTVKNLSEGKFEVTCEVEQKAWEDAQAKATKKVIDKVEIKGFRKGHVPADMAKKYISQGEVFNEAVNIVLPDVFAKAMEENKLNPFIRPQVNVDKLTSTELTIRFTIVVAPTVKLGKYKDIKIERKGFKVNNEEVMKEIDRLLEQNAELVVKNGEAKKGDTVIIDFDGFVDGKAFDGGSAKNYELSLGSGQFVPGFEDQLIGCKANDEKEVNVTFPEQYVENLKGKKATFKCKVHEVKEKKIPALNDETVKDLGIKDVTTVEALKRYQFGALTQQKNREQENAWYDSLVKEISKDAKVDIADEIVNEEANAMKQNLIKQVEQSGMKYDQYLQISGEKEETLMKRFKEQAKENIKVMLTLNAVAEAEKVTVSQEDIDNEMNRIAKLYNMDVKKVKDILGKDMNSFVNQIRSTKIHDLLVNLNK